MGQYLKGNNMAQIKIHNGGYYAHAQTCNAYNFCLSRNSTKFISVFMGQYLMVNNMVQIKIHKCRILMRMHRLLMLITSV